MTRGRWHGGGMVRSGPLAMLTVAAWLGTIGCSGDDQAPGPQDSAAGGGTVDSGGGGGGDGTGQTSGFGRACAGNADCAPFGLTCFLGANGVGSCSRGCQADADCGGGLRCNPVEGVLLCSAPLYCDGCQSDADCGPTAPLCRRDLTDAGVWGAGYCTMACNVGDKTCPAGSSCSKGAGSSSIKDISCRPDRGSCSGDGSQCSPCKTSGDCSPGHDCIQPSASSERFCALRCDNSPCAKGYLCTKLAGVGYCYAEVDGKAIPTCSAGLKGYCDACSEDWQCASGRCVTKEEKFCAQPGSCSKETEKQDCPAGTACVPSQQGQACVPPLAYKCHLWKACMSKPCGADEVCDDGVCRKAPKDDR